MKNPFLIYKDSRLILIFFMGIASGLPLLLTSSTLSIWLAEEGVSKTAVGIFALVGIPYSFKFLWAPAIDSLSVPFFTSLLGRRRGWLLFIQLGLFLSIAALATTTPAKLWPMAVLSILVAFFSASQDIVIDAFRVEILDPEKYGAGAALIVFGYRVGMILSGAMALYLATFVGWSSCYLFMAFLVFLCMVVTLLAKEPAVKEVVASEKAPLGLYQRVMAPFTSFMRRPYWPMILLFIISYKLGDAFAANMSSYFFIDIGFSKIEIANVGKIFGLGASIVGGLLGGALLPRAGIYRGLLFFGMFAMFSNLLFICLALVGTNVFLFTSVIVIEHIATGMSAAALVAYLSSLCDLSFTATQYALFSAIASFGRTTFSSLSGPVAEYTSWPTYFGISTLLAIPGLIMCALLMRKEHFSTIER